MQRFWAILKQGQGAFALLFFFFLLAAVYPSVCPAADIAGAEYFFDTDPGQGNGLGLSAADGAFDSQKEDVDLSAIDTSLLKIGSHTMYVRFMSDEGVWGMARPISYDPNFASPANFKITGEKWITAAEYYIDTDPGSGNGHPVQAADGAFDQQEEYLLLNNIDLSGFEPGQHTLYLRLLDNEESWGIIRQLAFEVYTPHIITAAEYYIDNDPGPGNGTVLTASDGEFNSGEEEVTPFEIYTAPLSADVHTLFVRFKDEHDRWGMFSSQSFAVGRPVAFSTAVPAQRVDGSEEIPLSTIVSDHGGSACKLKIEYRLKEGGESAIPGGKKS